VNRCRVCGASLEGRRRHAAFRDEGVTQTDVRKAGVWTPVFLRTHDRFSPQRAGSSGLDPMKAAVTCLGSPPQRSGWRAPVVPLLRPGARSTPLNVSLASSVTGDTEPAHKLTSFSALLQRSCVLAQLGSILRRTSVKREHSPQNAGSSVAKYIAGDTYVDCRRPAGYMAGWRRPTGRQERPPRLRRLARSSVAWPEDPRGSNRSN